MADYRQLLNIIRKELKQQEKILELLTRERAAVVKMNQEQLDVLNVEKDHILTEAQEIEAKRNQIISTLCQGKEGIKYRDIIAGCGAPELKVQLEDAGQELKRTAESVREFHTVNAQLLKQAMGLVASTMAIMRSAAVPDLPTYGSSGQMKTGPGNSVSGRGGSYTREA